MTWLILSVITNAGIYLIFKLLEQRGIVLFTAIVFNYITAFLLGLLVIEDPAQAADAAFRWPSWMIGGLSLGVVFIGVFYLMGITAQKVGVSVATIASKMSLALGVLLIVSLDPTETLGWVEIFAIILALAGVVLVSIKENGPGIHWRMLIFPVAILLGSTIIDFGVAWFSAFPETSSEEALFSCLSFGTAGCTGMLIIGGKLVIDRKYHFRSKDIIAGMMLGIVNYGSIFFLVKTYNSGLWSRSILLPVNNLLVVAVGAFAAILLFREKFNSRNWLGLGLCMIALVLLMSN